MSRDSPKGIHERKAGTSIDLFHANKRECSEGFGFRTDSRIKYASHFPVQRDGGQTCPLFCSAMPFVPLSKGHPLNLGREAGVPIRAATVIWSCQWKVAHDMDPEPKGSSCPASGKLTNYLHPCIVK